jgi:hypothetical protein
MQAPFAKKIMAVKVIQENQQVNDEKPVIWGSFFARWQRFGLDFALDSNTFRLAGAFMGLPPAPSGYSGRRWEWATPTRN